jgi:CYTH domain-containing protein
VEVDALVAAKLGFPKLRYVFVEHERRWLCTSLPAELVTESEQITDLYVTGTNLRLREARSLARGPSMLRLTRKVDVDPRTRLISSIYLQESEFALLRGALIGRNIHKRRHRLRSPAEVVLAVDEFEGELSGLMLLEAEFPSTQALREFQAPYFAGVEVTSNPQYTGGFLASSGLPNRTAQQRSADEA